MAGPDRCQAGQAPEPAGPKAGPDRFPGRHDRDGDGGGAMVTTARKRGRGSKGRRTGAHQELVGVARSGRGRPRRPEFVEDERGERRTDVRKSSSISSVPRLPACVLRWRR